MEPSVIAAWVIAAAPALPLLLTLFNIAVWQRGRPNGRMPGSVSVLIPARNEANNIEACLSAVLASEHPLFEVLVYDDASTDGTPALVDAIAATDRRARLIRGAELPRGWAGKSHACHRLALAAAGDILLFIDADVRLAPTGIGRLASLYEDLGADLASAVPRQETKTWGERLILPLLHLTYTSWLPLPLVHRSRDHRFLAVNGQIISLRRSVYLEIGGFESVKDNVVEDMAFCRQVKRRGFRVAFADGHDVARCRMYRSAAEVWEGFSKNLYRGLGASLARLIAVFALYTVAFVAPYGMLIGAALAAAWGWGSVETWAPWIVAGMLGVAMNTGLRAVLAWRYHQSWSGIFTHPLSVLALMAIGVNSFRWHQRGMIRWRGRVYGRQPELPTPAPPELPSPAPRAH